MARVELFASVEKTQAVTGAEPDPVTVLVPAVGASVAINIRGGPPATIYDSSGGGGTLANPLTVDADGHIDGWLNEGEYTLHVTGAGITTYDQPWEAVLGNLALALDGARIVVDSIPAAAYASGSVDNAALAAGVVNPSKLDLNVLPVGTVVQWWRPSSGHALPTGWLPCDGSQVAAINHNFTGGGIITLPDLRNVFVLGANKANADAQAGSFSDAASAAPGIRGAGSSHSRDLTHSHTVGDHTHTVWNHAHGIPDHAHQTWVPDHWHGIPTFNVGRTGNVGQAYVNQGGTWGASWYGASNSNSGYTNGLSGTWGQGNFESGGSMPGTTNALGSTDMRPKYVGLLYLIKVKNS